MRKIASFTGLSSAYFLLMNGSAFAYLDPGTGSMILQGIIGGALTVSVVVSGYYYRLKGWLSGRKNAGQDSKDGGE
ncbi:hypothetical protein [Phyllobacterium bourgognense]|uniref:Uncharacterized protein n=1 Tax=Phyllobacterium bourgognense TaxID=314236 RepID=A0A368YML5_9HYPH|nr:hypothetical protein [Phyllobacterium bourgognense]RCW80157.1 hypothetical protein C7476_115122 [Phyllobacterium bourgognense]